MIKKFLTLKDLNAYCISFNLSNILWNIIIKWNFFAKDTVGKQYVKAIDSISANIAEGFGRFNKKDKIRFYYYSLGSVFEAIDWTEKSYNRNLLTYEEYSILIKELNNLPQEIKHLISFTCKNLKY